MLMPAGRLADLYGRKRIFYIGLVTYIIFSILCGFSQSAIMLYVIRAFHGLASALIVPAASGMIGAIYHGRPRRRGHAFSLLGAFISGGFLAGIAVGGLTAELLTWRWLFWIMAILAASTVVSALLTVPTSANDTRDEDAPSLPPLGINFHLSPSRPHWFIVVHVLCCPFHFWSDVFCKRRLDKSSRARPFNCLGRCHLPCIRVLGAPHSLPTHPSRHLQNPQRQHYPCHCVLRVVRVRDSHAVFYPVVAERANENTPLMHSLLCS